MVHRIAPLPIAALLLGIGTIPTHAFQPRIPEEKGCPEGGPIVAACFSSDGKWILTADYNCRAYLWELNAESKKPAWVVQVTDTKDPGYDLGECSPLAIAFAADGKRVFCAWFEAVAEIDRKDGTILRTVKFPKPVNARGYGAPPPYVAFLPGSDECVYFGTDERLVRFDFKANKVHDKFNLRLPEIPMLRVRLSRDGKQVLAYDPGTGYLSEWDLATGELCRLYGKAAGGFGSAEYTTDGSGIWVRRRNLHKYDRRSGNEIEVPETLAKWPRETWFSPDGKHAIRMPWAPQDDRMNIIQAEDGKDLRWFSTKGLFYEINPDEKSPLPRYSPDPGLPVFTADGTTLLLTGGDKRRVDLGLWEMPSGKHIRMFSDKRPDYLPAKK